MDASPDPTSLPIALQLIFLAFLIFINAFFAAAEMSVVSANRNKIKLMAQEGSKKATQLLSLMEQPNKFLSTIQVVITLAGFLASASAAAGMSDDFALVLSSVGIPAAKQVAVVVVTLILSYATLVLGELYPKRIALQHSENIALSVVGVVTFMSKISTPFVWFLSVSVTLVMKITRQDCSVVDEEVSEEEIMTLLEVGQEAGTIDEASKEMINSIFEFDDILAYEVMTPRTDVYAIDVNDPLAEYVDDLLEQRFARVPVYDKDIDDIIGILYMKDFSIAARKDGFENVDIRGLLHKPYFVPESKNINELFRELQLSKKHIAILIDEYGGFSGIVTIEDLIEEIMGNINDEYDDAEPEIEKIDENTYRMDGLLPIDDLNEELELNIESENHETIGGFIMDLLGEIPSEETPKDLIVEYESLVFRVESVKERRIEKIKLYIPPQPEEPIEE